MNFKRTFAGIFCGVLFSLGAQAQQNEVTGSSSGSYIFDKYNETNTNSFSVSGAYDYALTNMFQVGAELAFGTASSSGTTITSITAMAGPTVNFGDSLNSAFFVAAKAGVYYSKITNTDSNSRFTAYVEAGKRFAITDSVAYKPSVGYSMIKYTSFTDQKYYVKFLALSVLF